MKPTTNIRRIIDYFVKLFSLINAAFYDNQLPIPLFTMGQNTRLVDGGIVCATESDRWMVGDNACIEMQISKSLVNEPIEIVITALCHAMVHYYNYFLGIKDCSRGNSYHNEVFKESALKHGLIVAKSEKSGWSIVTPSDELLDLAADSGLGDIVLHYGNAEASEIDAEDCDNQKSENRLHYQCPCCNSDVYTPRSIGVTCGQCNLKMVRVKSLE